MGINMLGESLIVYNNISDATISKYYDVTRIWISVLAGAQSIIILLSSI